MFSLNITCKHSQSTVEKVCELLDLITGWPSFGSNYLNQTFPVVGDQTCTMVRRNSGPFLSTKPFRFSNSLGMSGVMLQHLREVEVSTLTGKLQKAHFLLLKPFCCWFTFILWVVVLLHQPSSVELQLANRWSKVSPQNVSTILEIHFSVSHPGPEAAQQPQTMMLPPPYFTV